MKIKNVITTALLLSCTAVFASPVTHHHGTRTHSHNLPNTGMAHNHGSLPAATSAKSTGAKVSDAQIISFTLNTPRRINNNYNKIVAADTPKRRVAIINALSQLQGTLIVRSLAQNYKNEGGAIGVMRHKQQSKKTIRTVCNDYANKLQKKDQSVSVYKYLSEVCVAKAFKILRFNGAKISSDNSPANTVQGRANNMIKNKLEVLKKEKTKEIKNKIESALKDALGGFF